MTGALPTRYRQRPGAGGSRACTGYLRAQIFMPKSAGIEIMFPAPAIFELIFIGLFKFREIRQLPGIRQKPPDNADFRIDAR